MRPPSSSLEFEGGLLYNGNMTTLNRHLIEQTLRGYAEVNDFTANERERALQAINRAENWAIFKEIYESWSRTGSQAGGDWAAVGQQRLAEEIELRQAFERYARGKGLL
jgi:hypothetical protein